MTEYRTASADETIQLGETLAARWQAPLTILLIGNLGAGKTTLAKGIAKGLHAAEPEEVSSPTFTLIHEYGTDPTLFHIDLYRLDEPHQIGTLGLDEIFERNAIVLIEWGERFPDLMPVPRLEIRLDRVKDDERIIRISRVDS